MSNFIIKNIYKNSYYLIIAAWLFTISFIVSNYLVYNSTPEKVQVRLREEITRKENTFYDILKNKTLLNDLIDSAANTRSINYARSLPFGLFIYDGDSLQNPIFWNTTAIDIDLDDLKKNNGNYALSYNYGNFELLKETANIHGRNYIIAGMIPVYWKPFRENDYLKRQFEGFTHLSNRYEIATTGYPIYNSFGKKLFYFKEKKESDSSYKLDSISITLRVIGFLFLIVFFNAFCNTISKEKGYLLGYFIFAILLIGIRILMYFLPIPFAIRNYELFEPYIYASSSILPSLGDLLINCVIAVWLIIYFHYCYRIYSLSSRNLHFNTKWQKAFSFTGFIFLTSVVMYTFNLVKSIVTDSLISLDVLNFFTLNVYTYVAIGILLMLTFCIFYLLLPCIYPAIIKKISTIEFIVTILATGVILLALFSDHQNVGLNAISILWTIGLVLIARSRKKDLLGRFFKSKFLLIWMLIFAGTFSMIIVHENENNELLDRQSLAQRLAQDTDPLGESVLHIAMSNLSGYFNVADFQKLYSKKRNTTIKDSLANSIYPPHLNNFETKIYTFDSLGNALFNSDTFSLQSYKNILAGHVQNIKNDSLYFVENQHFGFSYLFYQKITNRNNKTQGFVITSISPVSTASQIAIQNIFDNPITSNENLNNGVSYAIYHNGQIVKSYYDKSNNYAFADRIPDLKLGIGNFKSFKNKKIEGLWYRDSPENIILIISDSNNFLRLITTFSLIFTEMLVLLYVIYFIIYLVSVRFRISEIVRLFRVNISSQVQVSIVTICIISFIVIGSTTISYFIDKFSTDNQNNLSSSMKTVSLEVDNIIHQNNLFQTMDPRIASKFDLEGDLRQKILAIANLNKVDINYFSPKGKLYISTQPQLFNNHILNQNMDPLAYFHLHTFHRSSYLQNEFIGSYKYLSIYSPVYDLENRLIGFINIPYLNSQNELHQEISTLLVTIMNLSALIIFLSGFFSYLVTIRISHSFELIRKKMRAINIGIRNKEIDWDRQDEIGSLVKEYNVMVRKLNISVQKLSKAQKEEAWQEMARQVAHEIKNPLTPMKLSIQYLQRAIENKSPNSEALAKRVSNTLVEQIDQLAQIASDFSQFANINKGKLETFDIVESMNKLVDLYRMDTHLDIRYNPPAKSYLVNCDKKQINRVFTNLIKNAIEATAESTENIRIDIAIEEIETDVLVHIRDFGEGISEEKSKKLFVPNFTTKSSGTGLGLAICKGICESTNGSIHFESQLGNGTTFSVRLPLATNENTAIEASEI